MTLDEFINDGRVYAAASVFPVSLEIDSAGRSPARFMLLNHPDGSWWAAAWANTYTSPTPELLLLARVSAAYSITASNISVAVEADDSASQRSVIVRPASGGCCGSRLKSWQPFGTSAQLVHKPYSQVEI